MAVDAQRFIERRRDQMLPMLSAGDIERVRRLGDVRSFAQGEYLSKIGVPTPGMFVILSGRVAVFQRDALGESVPLFTHAPGSFMAEIATLSGAPSLLDGVAQTPVEAIVLPAARLRKLMVTQADLGERIMRALILRRVGLIETGYAGPVILGAARDADVMRLVGFLTRNGYPHRRLDPAVDGDGQTLLERLDVDPANLPIVICPGGQVLRKPTEHALAECLGTLPQIDPAKLYDVAVVGAGPAGLATAVYAASEGLSVVTLDHHAFGGQAGASARIENYLGFPTGISGIALMARAYNQAQKFGVEISIPVEVKDLRAHPSADDGFLLEAASGERVRARTVVIASGARYRRPNISNLAAFEGAHVHYWVSAAEMPLCAGQEVALVGAGNSAGQAAVYLASAVSKVWLLVRGKSLEATMSHYLVDRIAAQDNIEVLTETEITALEGEGDELKAVRWQRHGSDAETKRAIRHVFLFVGAEPNTGWLRSFAVGLDAKGFVRTGDIQSGARPLETNRRGVFAIGDVRSGSVKRVASAVGEGAQVVVAIHAYLADIRERVNPKIKLDEDAR